MILAGDIGGTKTLVGLFAPGGHRPTPVAVRSFPTTGFDGLPAIIDAVGGRIPVLVDGGIRRGTDVMKALALGAKACLIGRPQLWGVAVAGEAGVARVLEIFAQEIERAMGLCGVTRTDQIDDSLLLKQRIGQAR